MKLYRIHEHGGPMSLRLEAGEVPKPGPGEILIRHTAVGVNFSDVQASVGGSVYASMPLPITPGVEGAGEIVAVGPDVTGCAPGDIVAYPDQHGAYAEQRVVPASSIIPVPPGLDTPTAVAVLTSGMTAHILAHEVHPGLRAGDTALVHAGAGAVTLLLIPMLKRLGVHVVTTVSTAEKAEIATTAGADQAINYQDHDFVALVREATDGRGVDVVFDGVGATTFEGSLACLRPRGYMIMFGEASGPPPMFAPAALGRGGSLFLTRMLLPFFIDTPADRQRIGSAVLESALDGRLAMPPCQDYAFDRAPEALARLQDRATVGKMILRF